MLVKLPQLTWKQEHVEKTEMIKRLNAKDAVKWTPDCPLAWSSSRANMDNVLHYILCALKKRAYFAVAKNPSSDLVWSIKLKLVHTRTLFQSNVWYCLRARGARTHTHTIPALCGRHLDPLTLTAFVTSGGVSTVPNMDKMSAESRESGRNCPIQNMLSVSRRFLHGAQKCHSNCCYRLSVLHACCCNAAT